MEKLACDVKCMDALEWLRSRPSRSIDLLIGSPPYVLKGNRYGFKKKWDLASWVDWMVELTTESLRVVRNATIWVADGAIKDDHYQPACEGLIWKLHERGIICERPCIWEKNSSPNGKSFFGNAYE